MTVLAINLVYCAVQVSLLAALAMLISARPWRIGGVVGPLAALVAIIAVTVCSFIPRPSWLPNVATIASALRPAAVEPTPEPKTQTTESRENRTLPDANQLDTPNILSVANEDDSSLAMLAADFWQELQRAPEQMRSRWSSSSLPQLVVTIFLLGVFVGLVRLAIGVRGTDELRRRSQVIDSVDVGAMLSKLQGELGLRMKIEVRQSDQLTTAATMGLFSPIILLPAHWKTWQAFELQAVLAHELAHIRHRDFGTQFLGQLGVVLHFYNPFVHWLAARFRLEQELAADALAAGLSGGQRAYLRVLATLALDQQDNHVGWPARAFLPTRQTFMRRLEMLRGSQPGAMQPTKFGRFIAVASIALCALGLVSLRSTNAPVLAQDAAVAAEAEPEFNLNYLDNDCGGLIAVRLPSLLASPQGKQIYEVLGLGFGEKLKEQLNLGLDDVQQMVIAFRGVAPDVKVSSAYFKFRKSPMLDAARLGGAAITLGQRQAVEIPGVGVIWQPDETSLAFGSRTNVERLMSGRLSTLDLASSVVWKQLKDQSALALVDGKFGRDWMEMARKNSNDPLSQMVRPIVGAGTLADEADMIGAGLSMKKNLQLTLLTDCQDEKGAASVLASKSAMLVLAKNWLREYSRGPDVSATATSAGGDGTTVNAAAAVSQLMQLAGKLLEAAEVKANGKLVSLSTQVALTEVAVGPFMAAADASRKAAARTRSANNLKQIGLAMHNFQNAYAHFPGPAALEHGPRLETAKHPYSWRVALLPYLGEQALYDRYKFDEPWDSPSNQQLLKDMPAVYRHADDPANSTNTSYVVLVGAETMFPVGDGIEISSISDGTSQTIMAVEAKTSIPWTKPEDLPYATDKPLPKLGGYSPEGYNVLMGDASVVFIANSIDEATLRAMITAQGQEDRR